jgi:tRNA-2-methylthio-N6-dimethylallyladenosine synthase
VPDEFSDSEIVASILNKEGFGATRNFQMQILFIKHMLHPEKAEQTVRKRLTEFKTKNCKTVCHWYARL